MKKTKADTVTTDTPTIRVVKPEMQVFTVNEPLQDIQLQLPMFSDCEPGTYVINYITQYSSQSLAVYYDGANLSL